VSYGLRPRAEVPAEELAALTAAAHALLSPVTATEPVADVTPAYRFSGRWFASGPLSSQRRPKG